MVGVVTEVFGYYSSIFLRGAQKNRFFFFFIARYDDFGAPYVLACVRLMF